MPSASTRTSCSGAPTSQHPPVLSPRTRGLVGARELALMKPTAFVVNTSRGPIVDEAAMLAALREKRIAGYGADTYDAEPLPSNHPLRSEPRALLTPHLGYVTEETYRGFYGGTRRGHRRLARRQAGRRDHVAAVPGRDLTHLRHQLLALGFLMENLSRRLGQRGSLNALRAIRVSLWRP